MSFRWRTVFEYLLLSIPLYIFVGSPLLKVLAPSYFGSDGDANYQSFENTDALVFPDSDLVCPPHPYNVRVLSREPLVVYIDGFLSEKEADHMVKAAYVSPAFGRLLSSKRIQN
jgi:prolyl 4-hydroxylase